MNISIKPLSADLLDDFLFFFDNIVFTENPGWSACYCYSFHFTGPDDQWIKESNRSAAIKLIQGNMMKGYLAFSDNKPVGWCNANNRNNYQRLLKYYDLVDNPDDRVCSIVCFLTDPDYRRTGIAGKILEKLTADYSSEGYDYLEAYPAKEAVSCEKNYKGHPDLYRKFDFRLEREYDDYSVVRKYFKPHTDSKH